MVAGAGLADINDVVDAATRMVCDKNIVGRGVSIGPRVGADEAARVGLDISLEDDKGQNREDGQTGPRSKAVWDIYAHDFEQSDVFTRRIMGLTNLVANVRGWTGLFVDLGMTLMTPIRRLLGL